MYSSNLISSLLAIGISFNSNILSASAAAVPACPHPELGQKFDYVIVGGGTAGLVLANRLTEQSGTTVAVIEAGTFIEDTFGNKSQVPGFASFFNTPAGFDVEWGFNTSSQAVSSISCLDDDWTDRVLTGSEWPYIPILSSESCRFILTCL